MNKHVTDAKYEPMLYRLAAAVSIDPRTILPAGKVAALFPLSQTRISVNLVLVPRNSGNKQR